MTRNYTQLSKIRLAFALGLIWGLGWLLLGWAAWLWQYGIPIVNLMASAYLGYAPTFAGAIIGGIWGFVDAFIFGFLVALVYNCCNCCGKKACEP